MVSAGWLKSIGSQIVYELDHKKPVLYVIPVENILGKLPLVPVGDTGPIPFSMRDELHEVDWASCDTKPGEGDGSRLWYVNSWALSWSTTM